METSSSGEESKETEEMSDDEILVPTRDEMAVMVFPSAKCNTCKKDIEFKKARIHRQDKHFCYGLSPVAVVRKISCQGWWMKKKIEYAVGSARPKSHWCNVR